MLTAAPLVQASLANVLVMDLRESMLRALGLEPASRRAAEQEALNLIVFDVVLMDVQIPEMDGWKATQAIRRREQATGGHIPILALTAHAMKDYQDRCYQAGMDGFLTKPFLPDQLYEAVESAVVPAVIDK